MRSRVLLIYLAVILCIIMTPLSSLGEDTKYPMTLTDSAGRVVNITMPIQRIISLNTNSAEVVVMLNAVDKVVAVDVDEQKKSEMPKELKKKQTVGKWSDPDYEMIGEIAKKGDTIVPDIVVITYPEADKPYGAAAVEKGLASFKNITVVGFKLSRPENMSEEITKIGTLLNKEKEAEDYLDWYEGHKKKIKEAVQGKALPKVYVEVWNTGAGLGALPSAGMGSALYNQIKYAGGNNICSKIEQMSPKVDWEWVTTMNPDVIVSLQSTDNIGWERTPSADSVKLEKIRSEILSRPGASAISAVKNDRVYVVSGSQFYGLDSIVGVGYFAKLFYPEVDLDPEQIYKEYLERMGVEYPEGRILIYPN
ncbi:MAG: ABC transporter substrate-binding protein [Methanothrix sp.]|nr:ABC transporter substrate-binding protein [Methanothrix sp.]